MTRRLTTIAAAFVLMLATVASAQPGGQRGPGAGGGPNFVDANGDGICDHFQAGGLGGAHGWGGPGAGCAWCGFGASGGSLVDIAATVAGRNRSDVVADLRAGQTFAQVMEANGKTSDDLLTAVVTNRREAIDRAVAAGRFTAQQGEAMLTRITSHVEQMIAAKWQPRGQGGPGLGGPCGGFHGHRHGAR